MSMISYAQNFEDVMLWRALGHVKGGFYIDVGAQHPTIDSVSKAFYEAGWRGIHVEPSPAFADLLRKDRPDETVLEAALGERAGIVKFYEIPDTGISTAVRKIAQQHRKKGFSIREIFVASITLADVFAQTASRDIHWLKIDVEGLESKVLSGWADSPARPWIVVVESTLPLSRVGTHQSWEPIITGYGYSRVYFDGLNCFYVSDAHKELEEAFKAPPNLFDDFVLSGFATARFYGLVEDRLKKEVDEATVVIEELRRSTGDEIERLSLSLASKDRAFADREEELVQQVQAEREKLRRLEEALGKSERETSVKIGQIQMEKEALLNRLAQREIETASQLSAAQEKAWQEISELARKHGEREGVLQAKHFEREQVLARQLEAEREKLGLLEREHSVRERDLHDRTVQARQEAEALLGQLLQREREAASQLLALQEKALQERAELARIHNEQKLALEAKHFEREQALEEQVRAERETLRDFEREWTNREQALSEQNYLAGEKIKALQMELAELARSHSERERAFLAEHAEREEALEEQLAAELEKVDCLEQEKTCRDKVLAEQTGEVLREKQALLAQVTKVEEELAAQHIEVEKKFTAQLVELCEQSEREKAEQAQKHIEELSALKQESAVREQALEQQLQGEREKTQELDGLKVELARLARERTEAEKALKEQSDRDREQLELLRHSLAQAEKDAAAQLSEAHEQARRNVADLELKLAGQLQAKRKELTQASRQIELLKRTLLRANKTGSAACMLEELLALDGGSFIQCAYEILLGRGADARGLKHYNGLLRDGKPKMDILAELCSSEEAIERHLKPGTLGAAICDLLREKSTREPIPGSPAIEDLKGAHKASELEELLTLEGARFIECAYQTLLDRAPDGDGLEYFMGKLQAGLPKIEVLSELGSSDEAKELPARIAAFDAAIRDYRARKVSRTLNGLLALHDQAFIECAYYTLLGRGPDLEGLDLYLGRLRSGASKLQILADLLLSLEGREHSAELPGLDAVIKRYRRRRLPLLGLFFRLFQGEGDEGAAERRMRSLENEIFRLMNESNSRLDRVESTLSGLEGCLAGQEAKTAVGMSAVDPGSAPEVSVSPASPGPSESADLKDLPPRAREIYFQLKRASAMRWGDL